LGYTPSILDPCCYLLHSKDSGRPTELDGIIMVATDDLASRGNGRHEQLMQQLRSRHKFGKWEYDSGRLYGKDIQQYQEKSIHVSQHYNKNAVLCSPKGVSNDAPCTIEQIKQLIFSVGFPRTIE